MEIFIQIFFFFCGVTIGMLIDQIFFKKAMDGWKQSSDSRAKLLRDYTNHLQSCHKLYEINLEQKSVIEKEIDEFSGHVKNSRCTQCGMVANFDIEETEHLCLKN